MKYYKVLDKHGRSCHGGEAEWSLPTRNEDGSWTPGEWMPPVEGDLEPCLNGYHVVSIEQLPRWLSERIFEVEPGKDVVNDGDEIITRTCRLTREYLGWNDYTARLFVCDGAEHVLPLYEAEYPNDDRPRKAIETARRYANGEATELEMSAAHIAAESAQVAAEGAALGNAYGAAQVAVLAALSAWGARDQRVLTDTIRIAEGVAASRTAERQWQAERLKRLLEEANGNDKE
jgi:hypothetical protein